MVYLTLSITSKTTKTPLKFVVKSDFAQAVVHMKVLFVFFGFCLVLIVLFKNIILVMVTKAKRQDTCTLCVQFFSILKSFIGNNPNATVQELEQFANTICALFPQYSTICEAFANQEITSIVDELEGANGPQDVCNTLGLCSSKKPKIMNIRL
jgi:hypothetical protein